MPRNQVFYGEKMDDSPNGQSSESKTREEDFWSISPERDFTQSSRLESDDGDEVVVDAHGCTNVLPWLANCWPS